jgi:hypothetical protein
MIDSTKWSEEAKRRCLVYGVVDIDTLLQWDKIKSVAGILFWSLLGHIAFAGCVFYPESDDGFGDFLSIDMEVDDRLLAILHESRANWLEAGIWANHLRIRLDTARNNDPLEDGEVLNVASLANLYLDTMKKRGLNADDSEFQRFIVGGRGK